MPLLDWLKAPRAVTTRLLLGLLLLGTVTRIAFLYPECAATVDEGVHIAAGVGIYQDGNYSVDLEHPPLSRFALGLFPYLSGGRILPGGPREVQSEYVLERSGDYWRTLTLGRLGNLLFLVVLVLYVFQWSSLLYGRTAGLTAAFLATFSPTLIAHAALATIDLSITATLVAAAYHAYRWFDDPSVTRALLPLYGRTAGLTAAFLATFSPTLIAHAALATIDLSITATLVAAAYHAYRWFDDPSVTRALLTGLASGLALLAKFSAIGFLPPILIGFLLLGWSANRTTGRAWNPLIWLSLLAQTALFCAAALLVVWACWQICPVPPSFPIRDHYLIVDQFLAPGSFPNSAVNQLIVWTRESIPGWIDGFVIAANHAYRGHPAQFLFGEIRLDGGWWYYFPVAFVLKSTLPFLVLIALAAKTMARQGFELLRSGSLFAVVAAVAVLSVGICSDLNIGVRHVLPMYPFLAIAASSLFACRDGSFARGRKVVTAAVLFLVLHGIASLAAHPDYLAYFNEMGRGREHRLLSDSNLDWGQDLGRLSRYLRDHGIQKVYVDCFGRTSPETVGIRDARPLSPSDRPLGWIAVSLTKLQGVWPPSAEIPYAWLLQYEPRAKIGKTIWLYYFEP